MMGGNEKSKLVLMGALGAGCLLGASGIILIQRLSHKMESSVPLASTHAIRGELMSIHSEIQEIHASIDELKLRHPPKKKALKSSLRTVTFADLQESSYSEPETSKAEEKIRSGPNNTSSPHNSSSDDEEQEFYDVESDSPIVSSSPPVITIVPDTKLLELFHRVDDLLEGQSVEQKLAYVLLKENEPEYKENNEFLWRLCKSLYMMAIVAGSEGDPQRKKDLIYQSIDAGKASLELLDTSAEAHKWYAIAIGTRGEFLGLKDKILDGYTFKKHIDRAGELAPRDHSIQHLLGRFCFEVAELSWFERKMASTLFADPPTSSMEEALEHFRSAEELKPDGWKENRVFLAKCLLRTSATPEGVSWLKAALKLPVISADDRQVHEEALSLLKEHEPS